MAARVESAVEIRTRTVEFRQALSLTDGEIAFVRAQFAIEIDRERALLRHQPIS